jgi:hypothetical protein
MLSDEFAPTLDEIGRTCHVWAVRTPSIEAVTRRIWDAQFDEDANFPEAGVTLFEGRGEAERGLLAMVDEVELLSRSARSRRARAGHRGLWRHRHEGRTSDLRVEPLAWRSLPAGS